MNKQNAVFKKSQPRDKKDKQKKKDSNFTGSTEKKEVLYKENHLDIVRLVRSLQRSAGHTDCFRSGIADCDVLNCEWRLYCFGG